MKNICNWNNCKELGEYKAPIERDNSKKFRMLCLKHVKEFNKKEVTIYGISKCSVKKHEKFCSKYSFEHELLSDEDNTLCEDFGVWKEKSMYGKKYMGIERSTFLINEDGLIIKSWEKVKVPGHVENVLESI